MSNNLHTSIQLLVLISWITIFVYSYFRKWQYLSLAQKILIPTVATLSSIRYTTLFNVVQFSSDWYAIVFYLAGISVPILFAFSFYHKEVIMDREVLLENTLEIFKKISYTSSRAICAIDIKTNELLYINKKYKELYKGKEGDIIEDFCPPEYLPIYIENNRKVIEALGEVLEFNEPTHTGEIKTFKKFYAIIDNRPLIIIMSKQDPT